MKWTNAKLRVYFKILKSILTYTLCACKLSSVYISTFNTPYASDLVASTSLILPVPPYQLLSVPQRTLKEHFSHPRLNAFS